MVNPFHGDAKKRIVDAIIEAEKKTGGEIRVHIKATCGPEPMDEAKKIFLRLRMHRTKQRNGVLVFVAWKSQKFAILGDEGLHRKVGANFWDRTRDTMTNYFLKNDFVNGVIAGVKSAGEKLKEHFPAQTYDKNELSNTVSEGT